MAIDELWVWARGRVLAKSNEARWRSLFSQVGFTDAVLILNDFGFDDFGMFQSPQRVYEVARRYQDVGIRPHLMSWIKPDRDFILRAADTLIPLCERGGLVSLQWDVEEYWTQHKADHAQVAHEVVAPAFRELLCPMGVTGITSLKSRVKPMIQVSHYTAPQAYSFASHSGDSWHVPGRTQRLAHKFWSPLGREMVMGLACYNQGSSRSAARRAMAKCVEQSLALGHRRLCYWDCRAVESSATVRGFLTELGQSVRRGPSFLGRPPSLAGRPAPSGGLALTTAGISSAVPLVVGGAVVLGLAALRRIRSVDDAA